MATENVSGSKVIERYKEMLGSGELTADEIARINHLQTACRLGNDDPMWELILSQECYLRRSADENKRYLALMTEFMDKVTRENKRHLTDTTEFMKKVNDDYHREIEGFCEKTGKLFDDALKKYRDNGGAIYISENDPQKRITYLNLLCVFAVMLVFGVFCFFSGAALSEHSPGWITEASASSALGFLMQVPAGCLFFILSSVPAGITIYLTIGEYRHDNSNKKDKIKKYGPQVAISALMATAGAICLISLI